ncbi:MAG: hypothetical protein ACOC4I_02525 [Spirochaetota bacterium]
MKPVSLLFFGAALWECVRFALVLVHLFAAGVLPAGRAVLVWFSSPQLVLAAALVVIAVDPRRYRAYRPIIVLGKSMSVIAGIIALTGLTRAVIGFPAEQLSPISIAIVVAMDVVVLAVFALAARAEYEVRK